MAKLYGITTEYGFDQVCETEASANREKQDLKALGFRVRVFVIEHTNINTCWAAMQIIEAAMSDRKPFGRKGMKNLENAYGVTVTLK